MPAVALVPSTTSTHDTTSMKIIVLIAAFLCTTLLAPLTASPRATAVAAATGTVKGRVLDWATNNPKPGVTVKLYKGPFNQLVAQTTTNSLGKFTFNNVAAGPNVSYRVNAAVGYHKVNWYFTLAAGQVVENNYLKLSP